MLEVSSFYMGPSKSSSGMAPTPSTQAFGRKHSSAVRNKRPSRSRTLISSSLNARRISTALRSNYIGGGGGGSDYEMGKDEEAMLIAPETIAEMIEVSFIQSCLQLSQGYIDVLKLFIVAVKAGYERSLSLDELHALVELCPVNSAGRNLMNEEKQLRLEWMKMVYALLMEWNPNPLDVTCYSGDDGNGNARISGVTEAMLSIQRTLLDEESTSGGRQDAVVTMTNLTVDQALAKSSSLSMLYESTANDPMERAILTNDIRVAILTFRVLEEERVCLQDKSSDGSSSISGGRDGVEERVPRPPIPGT